MVLFLDLVCMLRAHINAYFTAAALKLIYKRFPLLKVKLNCGATELADADLAQRLLDS